MQRLATAHTPTDGSSRQNHLLPSILTLADVARVLRCSKAHVSNIIRGKVPYLPLLPVVRIGRRVLIRDESLNQWMRAVEDQTAGVR